MKDNNPIFPIPESLKAPLVWGYQIIISLLLDEDTPFSQGVLKILDKENGISSLKAFVDKCYEDLKGDGWDIPVPDLLTLYMMTDLVARVLRSGEVEVLRAKIEPIQTEEGTFDLVVNRALEVADDVLKFMAPFTTRQYYAWYIWRAERIPDPVTGISPAMAIFNHIPTLPKNPTQLIFNDYGEDTAFHCNVKKNAAAMLKNMNCMKTIFVIVNDEDNPPAKIITAYFPNIERELGILMGKFTKDRRRKKVDITEGEFGLLYAITDLYGRLHASSYRNIIPILENRMLFPNPNKRKLELMEDDLQFITQIVDLDLQAINENFSDISVIQAYRAIAKDMVWFDD